MNTRGSTCTSFVTHLQTRHGVSVNTSITKKDISSASVENDNETFYHIREFVPIFHFYFGKSADRKLLESV